MDDKRMEGMLRESWSPEPPDGMRERVLRRARAELGQPTRPAIFQWKPLLATLAIVIVLLTNISDQCRQSRLAAMTDGFSHQRMTAPQGGYWLQRRKEIEKSLALAPEDGSFFDGSEGDELL